MRLASHATQWHAVGLALMCPAPVRSFSFNIALAGFAGWLCIAVYLVVRGATGGPDGHDAARTHLDAYARAA